VFGGRRGPPVVSRDEIARVDATLGESGREQPVGIGPAAVEELVDAGQQVLDLESPPRALERLAERPSVGPAAGGTPAR